MTRVCCVKQGYNTFIRLKGMKKARVRPTSLSQRMKFLLNKASNGEATEIKRRVYYQKNCAIKSKN